jgi:hypothetical protein
MSDFLSGVNAAHESRMAESEGLIKHSKEYEMKHIADLMISSKRKQLTMDEYKSKNAVEMEALSGRHLSF